jgi:hypothetical protein
LPEEEIIPKMEEILFPAKLITTLEDIEKKIGSLPFYIIEKGENELSISKIENPFLFYIFRFRNNEISIIYSIAPDTSIELRRLTVIKDCMSILSIINDDFKIDNSKFFQYLVSITNDIINNLSKNYSDLVNRYDALITEYKELKILNFNLTSSNRNLTMQASQLDSENKKLNEQMKILQTYSDESIMVMLQDWIQTHNNSIDIIEFSNLYKILPPRTEQVLDKMISLGYIKLNE